MNPTAQITSFAQDVYLIVKNRFFDGITEEDGQTFVQQVISQLNMFLDELEQTTLPDGEQVQWWFARENGATLGTAVAGDSSIALPAAIDHVIAGENRYVQILQDTSVVANFAVVQPDQITNKTDRIIEDTCAVVGTTLMFSRPFKSTEDNGTIIGDVINSLPRVKFTLSGTGVVTATNVAVLSTVKPLTLLKLGVAKNVVLPDIVQGKLTPNFERKFDNLMAGAIARSIASSRSSQVVMQDYSGIRGVY